LVVPIMKSKTFYT